MLNLLLFAQAVQLVGTLVTSAPSQDFMLEQPGRSLSARVDANGISGPEVQLSRSGNELRGRIRNLPTELQMTSNRVTGLVGRQPVDLHVTRDDSGLHVQGLFAGRLSNLRINVEGLDGALGRCGYTLHAEGAEYQGQRSCGGLPEPVTVRIPQRLTQRSPVEFVATLAALLGQAAP